MESKTIVIYTDGACKKNPGPGGWGAVLRWGSHEKHLFGGELLSTNNRMELMAAIRALQSLKRHCTVHIFTDSKYVHTGINEWVPNWKRNNWRTASGGAVKNKELWIELDQAIQGHDIQWFWVKGHSGDEGNDLADLLANKGVESVLYP
ncbi:MAG: ribonuclease HI [Pseudomonadota bacterium]